MKMSPTGASALRRGHRSRHPGGFGLRGIAVAAGLLLSGCAHTQYLTRSCITQDQLKQLKAESPPKIRDKLTGKADEDTRPLAGSILQLRAYSGMLLGVLETCAEPVK